MKSEFRKELDLLLSALLAILILSLLSCSKTGQYCCVVHNGFHCNWRDKPAVPEFDLLNEKLKGNTGIGINYISNYTIWLYPDGSDWYHGQDTIQIRKP